MLFLWKLEIGSLSVVDGLFSVDHTLAEREYNDDGGEFGYTVGNDRSLAEPNVDGMDRSVDKVEKPTDD